MIEKLLPSFKGEIMAQRSSEQTFLYTGLLKDTPLGDLWLAASDRGLVAVEWAESELEFGTYLTKRFKRPLQPDPSKVAPFAKQLHDYLNGKRRRFTIPIDWSLLRPFQREVLQATFAIPFGQTRTYGELAAQVGRPRAARAVGRAQATNPMPLVIPCHRVIGKDGKLHGYGGGQGLPTKAWLLKLEGSMMA
jgi:methylated-DNA-[protein]-cysteine S-methyltransferase